MGNGTYSCAVVVAQKTQMDLAVQVDGWKIDKGENHEGESGCSGIAILNQLYCTICWIRTPGRQGKLQKLQCQRGNRVKLQERRWVKQVERQEFGQNLICLQFCVTTQGDFAVAPLLSHYEILADRVARVVDWRGPTRVQNSGDLPFINSFCPHLHIQPLVKFHFYIPVTGQGGAEVSVLVENHSHMIVTLATWKLLLHKTTKKQHIL